MCTRVCVSVSVCMHVPIHVCVCGSCACVHVPCTCTNLKGGMHMSGGFDISFLTINVLLNYALHNSLSDTRCGNVVCAVGGFIAHYIGYLSSTYVCVCLGCSK